VIQVDASIPAAIYTRISSDPEDQKLGVKRQEKDCRALADRNGWKVSRVYSDNDLSAAKRGVRRPAYEDLLADIERGAVRRLIIDKPDRLYRRNVELEHLIDVVEGAGHPVEIAVVKQAGPLDLSTTNGRKIARILGAIAQGEVEDIRDRTKRKHQEKFANGEWHGGPRPFGWRLEGRQLVAVPEEFGLLREAKDRILAGDNLHAIAADWARRGVRSARGKVIADPALQRMLESPRLIGEYAGGVKGQWEPVLSREEWEQLRLVVRGKVRPQHTSSKYLLVGLLTCGNCGERMYGRPNHARVVRERGRLENRGRDYGCHTRPGSNACGRVFIRESILDEYVMGKICDYFTSPQWAKVRSSSTDAPAMNVAVLALAKVQVRLEELAAAYGAGKVTMSEWLTAKRGLDPALKAAQEALDSARLQTVTHSQLAALDADHFVAHWREMDLEARRKVVDALLFGVEVNPAGDDRASRVVMYWR
jgi:DNA invertase Pin-like site-specific DNA recombinase